MLKKGIIVTIIFIVSTAIQLISQIVITRVFGAKLDLDIFLAAVSIPAIVVTVIYGTLNDVFLPWYGKKRVEDPDNGSQYFFSALFSISIISLVCSWILSITAPFISDFFFGSRGTEFVNHVSIQMSYMFYSFPLAVIATLCGSYFYTHKNFTRFPIAQALGSFTNLVIILLLAPYYGVWSLVIAFVVNIIIQIAFVIPSALFSFRFQSINLIPLFLAWIPLIIGTLALRSDTLLIRSFGSQLPTGYLVHLNLISKIFALSTSIMTIGIQTLLLPHLVDYFNQKEYTRAIQNINKAKIIAIGISIVVTIMLTLFAPLFIQLLFVGGKFTQNDANVAISILPLFIIPAIGWGINGVFFQPLLALHKQLPLGILNVISLLLGWGTAQLVSTVANPLIAISSGLIILLFTGIIGSELLWQYYKKKLHS